MCDNENQEIQITILIITAASAIITIAFNALELFIEYKKEKKKEEFQQKNTTIINTINEVHQHVRRLSENPALISDSSVSPRNQDKHD